MSDTSAWMSSTAAAERWGISRGWVQALLRTGQVPGAIKVGRDWLIPEGTPLPEHRFSLRDRHRGRGSALAAMSKG